MADTGIPSIAVVDDEESVRVALSRLCRSSGFQVEVFRTGVEFMAAFAVKRPDCIILDLHMPAMTGLEVQARVHQSAPHLPVIILTGYDTPETRQQAMAAGAAAYFCKPVNAKALLGAIAAALAKPDPGNG